MSDSASLDKDIRDRGREEGGEGCEEKERVGFGAILFK